MLSLKCLGTGSSGNCWLLKYGNEVLILDAGINPKTIKQGLEYNLMSVQGVCITHTHKDHSLAANNLKKMGLQVFEPYKCDVRHKTFGSFKVQAFSVPHGDCLCFGFYIKVADHKLIYATDFEYIPFNFHKQALDTLIVECNYQDEYVDRDAPNFDHKILDHCELQTTIGVVKANQTDYLKNVIITHMGESTANAIECVTEIKRVTKDWVNVDYARPGATYILSK